jgi:hypothetical protein
MVVIIMKLYKMCLFILIIIIIFSIFFLYENNFIKKLENMSLINQLTFNVITLYNLERLIKYRRTRKDIGYKN